MVYITYINYAQMISIMTVHCTNTNLICTLNQGFVRFRNFVDGMDEIYCLEKFITNCDKGLIEITAAHFITNCDKGLLQIATSTFIQIATGTFIQIATSFITNCDRYYKLRQPLLKIATVQMLASLASACN